MPPSGRTILVSCAIALSGFISLVPASAQVSFDGGGTVFIPGQDGVLWLDGPSPDARTRRYRTSAYDRAHERPAHVVFDDEINPRYLRNLSRKAHTRSRPTLGRRIADSASSSTNAPPPSEDVTRSIGDSDRLREQVARLSGETASLRSEIAALKNELSKRTAVSQDRPESSAADKAIADKSPSVEAPRTDELGPIRQEAVRLKDETSRLRTEGDALRGQVSKLGAETTSLRTGIAALKDELAKRPLTPPKAENPAPNEIPKVKEEAARLKEETARLRAESDSQRDQIAKLSTETGGLRSDIATLKDELAKRPVAPPVVSGNVDETLKKNELLRKEDALKKSTKDNKFAERPPLSKDEQRAKGDREGEPTAGFVDKVWRRLIEMLGRTTKEAP